VAIDIFDYARTTVNSVFYLIDLMAHSYTGKSLCQLLQPLHNNNKEKNKTNSWSLPSHYHHYQISKSNSPCYFFFHYLQKKTLPFTRENSNAGVAFTGLKMNAASKQTSLD